MSPYHLLRRTKLGKNFSEGARLLWKALDERGGSQAALADVLGIPDPMLNRWLYGVRQPIRKSVLLVQDKLGIPVTAWYEKPSEPFIPPAARAEEALERKLQVLAAGADRLLSPAFEGDVGYDLCAAEEVELEPLDGPVYVPTGVHLKAPDDVWVRVVGRAATLRDSRVLVIESGIDNAFTGELLVPCINLSRRAVQVHVGDRLAQLVCFPVVMPKIAVVEALPETGRGERGFGSTGGVVGSRSALAATG